MKRCTNCKIIYPPTTEFFFRNKNMKDGLGLWCKKCYKKWSNENKVKLSIYWKKYRIDNLRKKKDSHLRLTYGISIDGYEKLFKQQKGVCAICSRPETTKSWGAVKLLAVDHNHRTGKIRGLLCNNCNRALGLLGENENIVEALLNYLRNKTR